MKLAERFNYLYMLRTCWRLGDRRERLIIIGIYVAFIFANICSLCVPLVLGRIVQTITQGGENVLPKLIALCFVWLGFMILFWAGQGPGRFLERNLSYALRTKLTNKLYCIVTNLPWNWHQNHHSGGVLNRVNLATQSIYDFCETQYLFVQLVMTIGGSIFVLLWIAPVAGTIMAISLPLLTLGFRKFDMILAKLSRAQAGLEGDVAAGLTDYFGNIATVLTLRLQKASNNEVMRRLLRLKEPMLRSSIINESKWVAFGLSMRVVQIASLIGFVWESRNIPGPVMAGIAVAMLQYMQQVSAGFLQAASVFQTLIRSRINVENADFSSDIVLRSIAASVTHWHTARIDDLAFSYQDREHHAHHLHVSLDLARGRKVALVGTSGSGKSTLLRLLRGLHDADAGTLTIDGVAYPSIAPLADLSTLVPQDPEIFENTIRYNITCGIAEDEMALNAAIHTAALESVIDELPQGLDTDIRERGVNLSGGQKQRLALARGILAARDSSLILLDEPTSSLDAATESTVFNRLFAAYPDACIVASLHRLHLLERFDYVYVMEAGRVVEQGSFADLVATGGVLSRLWKAQQAERA